MTTPSIRRGDPVADAPLAAALHAAAFAGMERAWSAAEIAALAAAPGGFLLLASAEDESPAAMLVGRAAGGEAEVLGVGAAPAARRRGLGRALMQAFAQEARAAGAREGFLEVAADNAPARALYESAGWRAVGLRRNYAERLDGTRVDAAVMALTL